MLSQSNMPGTGPAQDTSRIDNRIQALQDAIAQQQAQIEALRAELAEQKNTNHAAQVVNASLSTLGTANTTAIQGDVEKPKDSPLSFRIGAADFTPGGFVDFENIFRSTNTGNVAGTNFWAIPFNNTPAGHLTEFRSTGQYSRLNLKTHAKFGQNDVTGFIEFDFNGNDATNVFVTSNSHTDRLRHYWLDLKRGKWEFVGGQAWGLLTANRVGVGPTSADVFTTFNEDGNHQVGNNFTRAAQFRAGYHFNDHFAWAVALENPQQFAGQGAEVAFPVAFTGATNAIASQFDAAATPTTPNVSPDIISKFAYDNEVSGRHFHFELGGLFTAVKITDTPTVAGSKFISHSKIGGGIEYGLNFDFLKGSEGKYLRFVTNGLWGPGVGRYLIGTGPQAVVAPVSVAGSTCTSAGNCDLTISMVHAGNALAGFEFVPHPKAQFGIYYGGAYFQRNAFPDITSPAATKPIIGFGGIGAANAGIQNRSIQEVTIDWTQTLWKNPQYGALLFVTQTSYVTRSPWFAATNTPKNAHLTMGYVSLKYVLP